MTYIAIEWIYGRPNTGADQDEARATIVPRDDVGSPHPVLFGTRTDCFAVSMPARVSFDLPAQWQLVARP